MKANGKCLCGSVTVSAEKINQNIGACHCTMCRKWTGGSPFFATNCEEISFSGEENIQTYNSSAWGERGFCKKCGTNLFYKLKEKEQYILSAGLFDGVEGYNFDHQIFIDEKPDWYDFANETTNMTGAEVFAKFSS